MTQLPKLHTVQLGGSVQGLTKAASAEVASVAWHTKALGSRTTQSPVIIHAAPSDQPKSLYATLTSRTSVVLSGGLGSLGLLFAKWMGVEGQLDIVLLGRSGRGSDDTRELHRVDGVVSMLRCDVAITEESCVAVTDALSRLDSSIGGIVHAGGILRDAVVSNQTARGMREVAAPKVAGT